MEISGKKCHLNGQAIATPDVDATAYDDDANTAAADNDADDNTVLLLSDVAATLWLLILRFNPSS